MWTNILKGINHTFFRVLCGWISIASVNAESPKFFETIQNTETYSEQIILKYQLPAVTRCIHYSETLRDIDADTALQTSRKEGIAGVGLGGIAFVFESLESKL